MTQHDELIRLEHMLGAAREAVELVRGRSAKDIGDDRLRVLALERLLEVVGEADAESVAGVRALVLAAIRKGSGDEAVNPEADGDIALRFGNAVVLVRVLDDPLCVRLFSPVLVDVTGDDGLVERVSALNAGVRYVRVFLLDGTLYAALELFVKPFVGEHVWSACMQVGSFADEVGEDLRKEWGGRRGFEDENEALAVQ